MYKLLYRIGASVITIGKFFKGHSLFAWQVSSKGLFSKHSYSPVVQMALFKHIYYSGIELLVTITIAALLLGMTLVNSITNVLIALDAAPNIGPILTIVIIRITAPLVSGVLIILRTSTTLLVDIGMMNFNREIKALEAMNIDPYIYLYFPRILSSVISMVVLSIYFSVIAIVGGYTLLSYQSNTSLDYVLSQIISTLSMSDVVSFVFKTVLIGFIAASIPIYVAQRMQNSRIALIQGMTSAMVGIFFTFIIVMILGEIFI